MDTPSTSVSGAMGRSTKRKKVPKWKESDNTYNGRDSTCTPPTLVKVNSWIDTLDQPNRKDEEDRNRSPDFYGFNNLNYSPTRCYDSISNRSCSNEEKLTEDELNQYCNVSISEIDIDSRPVTRQRKFSNIIEKDCDDCDSVLPSPENENKKELCKYLQLMKPTDKKSVMILENRRSKRVKNLSIMQDKKLRTSVSDQENYEEKRLEYQAPSYHFPQPPDNIAVMDFDRIAEESWFKKWSEAANKGSDRTPTKRKSNVSVEDIMLDECSEAESRTTRRKSELFDSNKNRSPAKRSRSESKGPAKNRSTPKRNSVGKRGRSVSRASAKAKKRSVRERDSSESSYFDDYRSTTTKKSIRIIQRSESRNSYRRATRSETSNLTFIKLNGAQNKNGFKEKAKPKSDSSTSTIAEDEHSIITKTQTIEDNTVMKLPTVMEDDKALNTINVVKDEPTKAGKTKANNSKKVKGPFYKIRLASTKKACLRKSDKKASKISTNSKPRLAKKPQNNLTNFTINEIDFETKTNAIKDRINLSRNKKNTNNPTEIYLADSCSDVEPEIFGSQLKNLESWPGSSSSVSILDKIISDTTKLSSSTTDKVHFQESDPPKFNGTHDSAIQTKSNEKREFYSQIIDVQKTSDEDTEEEKSRSTPKSGVGKMTTSVDQLLSHPKHEAKWLSTKKQQDNQNSINLNTRQGPILKIFYVDFDLVLCQELSVSFWNQSAPGNVLGARDMWTNKGSIQRQAMNNNCTLKESLEMVACNYFSLAYIELWTKEHESYQQEVPITNVYAIVYYWMKQYNGLVKKVLQLENINGFADDVQYSIVKSSPKIVVSWHFAGNEVNRKKTYVCCYQVASDFQSICNVDKFETVDHYVSSLHNIEGCDTLIMGCGENKITLWNIEGGRLAATIEMAEIKSPLATLWVKCDRGFLFTLQQCVDRELRLIAIHSMNHSWKRLASYAPPEVYDRLKGVCVENGIVLAFYDQGIICWNAGTQEIVVEAAARKEIDYISGKYLISIANNEVNVRHAVTSLLDVGYWN